MTEPLSAPVIALDQLRLVQGGRTVLDDVTLTIAQGEFVGVLGPNGAGKTTLLRAILGLVPASYGGLTVLGCAPGHGNGAIGYLPQSRAVPGVLRLRGQDVIASGLGGHRLGLPWLGRDGRREVARVLDLVDASDLARRSLADMSGGERQRLMLAQSLMGAPRLLLLDEPLISLDLHQVRAVIVLVKRVQQELGITVLFTAHDLNPLLGALDRVLYLGGGHAALGTVAEVITGPVLSRLYGSPVDVVRVQGRIFVMSGDALLETDGHGGCGPGSHHV